MLAELEDSKVQTLVACMTASFIILHVAAQQRNDDGGAAGRLTNSNQLEPIQPTSCDAMLISSGGQV